MPVLTQQRCFEHGEREAVARCLTCSRYFCRECVTEHDGRVMCMSCLRKATPATAKKQREFAGLFAVAGLIMAWFFFYGLGEMLVLIPADVHEPRGGER